LLYDKHIIDCITYTLNNDILYHLKCINGSIIKINDSIIKVNLMFHFVFK
jgi:hypothetical protein